MASDVLTAIDKLLHNKTAKQSVGIFHKQLAGYFLVAEMTEYRMC